MNRTHEEILEAVWKADENGDTRLEAVRRLCPIEIPEGDLDALHRRGLIGLEGGQVTLSPDGRQKARGVLRRHRLAEALFTTALNLDAEAQERIACEVEHTLLPEMEEAICTMLGHPDTCPDGKPIPPGRCCSSSRKMTSTVIVKLTDLEPGERGRISYIKPKQHERLHRLTSFGLTPGIVVTLHQTSPAYCIQYEGTELALNHDVADDIYVAKMD